MQTSIRHLALVPAMALALLILSACQKPAAPAPSAAAPTTALGPVAITQIVATQSGQVAGEARNEQGIKLHLFRGIPYAASTAGDNRWRPPQPVPAWEGVRDATAWGDRCPQPASTQGTGDISEDCLTLNVVTPASTNADKLPVMVFFHGGGLTLGTANSPLYNHTGLPLQGVVLVTVNSRLGPLGYLAHPALSAASGQNASGNIGTLDLIASLQWVQQNIRNFGGDPDNVLIFGESGGGTKVLSLLASPLAEGLFHRAVVQSGSALASPERVTTLAAAETQGARLAAQVGAADAEDVLAALRATPWQDLVAAASDAEVAFRANLVVDGWVLPESVHDTFRNGNQHAVPLMIGANAGEGFELQGTVPVLADLASSSANVYVYNFSFISTGWRELPCVAFHGLELPYVFGYVPEGLTVPTILFLAPSGGCTTQDPGADAMDLVVADHAMRLWTAFARTGDPSVEGLINWPAYTAENDLYLDIGYALAVKQGIRDAYTPPPGR